MTTISKKNKIKLYVPDKDDLGPTPKLRSAHMLGKYWQNSASTSVLLSLNKTPTCLSFHSIRKFNKNLGRPFKWKRWNLVTTVKKKSLFYFLRKGNNILSMRRIKTITKKSGCNQEWLGELSLHIRIQSLDYLRSLLSTTNGRRNLDLKVSNRPGQPEYDTNKARLSKA